MKRLLVLCLVFGFAHAQEQAPAPQDLASLLPAETLLVCEGNDLGGMDRWARETALGRLWSDPEVQHFAQGLVKSIAPAFEAANGPLGIVGLTMEDLRGIRARRGGFAVVDASLKDGGLHLDLVLFAEFRKGADKARKVVQALQQAAQTFAAVPFEEVRIRDKTVWRAQVQAWQVFLWMEGARLLVTTQRARMDQMLLALQSGNAQSLRASARYAKIRARMGAGHFAFFMYADVPRIVARAKQAATRLGEGEDVAEFEEVWRKLGLNAMESVAVADIPSGTGFRTELAVTFEERRGVFALAQPGRPGNRFARYAPAHSLIYGAERFDLAVFLDALLGLTEAFGVHDDVDALVQRANAALGVDLRQDVAAALGTEWAGYLARPPEGGLIPDYAMFVTVRDRARLEKALETIAARLPALAEAGGVVVRVNEAHFRGVRIRFLELSQGNGDPIPVAPAWALTDDFLVLALVPQTVKHALLEKRSLQGSDEFRTLLRRIPQSAVSHTYVDMKGVVAWIYNTAVPVLQVVQGAINKHLGHFCDEMRMSRIQLNFQDLPPAEVLTRHLSGAMFYSAVEGDCVRVGYVAYVGATLFVAPFMMLGMTATLVAKGEHEEAIQKRRRAERARQRRSQLERLRAENALLRKRLDRIEREIAEIKRLVEEPR
ncbi:MAG: hypothetical protein ACYS0K_07850 [Planctomycetota bacterium]|jgi:hypothetical protein